MASWKSILLFLIWGLFGFILTVMLTGLISYWLPRPSEFITTIISIVIVLYVSVRLSKYNRWPLLVMGFMLLFFSLGADTAKKFIHSYNADRLIGVTVTDAAAQPGHQFFHFTDSRPLWDHAGHHSVHFYGEHHYYAIPVVGSNWIMGDKVDVWTWARTKKEKTPEQLDRIFADSINYGITLQNTTIERMLPLAMQDAEEKFGIRSGEFPVIINWGEGDDLSGLKKKLIVKFLIFAGLLILLVGVESFVSGRRNLKESAQ